jgi:hypothetical protein
MNNARIAALMDELKSIHFANVLYWTAGAEANRGARAEYFRRQDRVLKIRAELVALKSGLGWPFLCLALHYIRQFLVDSSPAPLL